MAKRLILNLDALLLRAHRCLGPTGRMLAKQDEIRSKFFRMTHFRKNASATPLVSHTFKTKDLKPFRFTHFQKKGWGRGPDHRCPARKRGVLSNLQTHTSNLCSSLSPLDSALTSERAPKSFTCNTYEKHTGGEGGCLPPNTNHGPRITGHGSRITASESFCRPRTYIGNV